MLATLGARPPEGPGWAWELKWDGIRALGLVQDGALRLWTRNGNDISARYPELAALPAALDGHDAFLDGEIVAFDERGRPSFGHLQRRMHVQAEPDIGRLAVEVEQYADEIGYDNHARLKAVHEARVKIVPRV